MYVNYNKCILELNLPDLIIYQGTNVAHNVRGGLLIDLTIVAIALLLMPLKLTDITQWNVSAVALEQF